ncbi:MAG: hypothetical protein KY461_03400 [Actinobacteria bacterium]|nr:hypothetical protein [Actinomycetota bacterium]
MTIRLPLLAAVLAVALLLPTAASAAATATLVSPGRDARVSTPVGLEVRVSRDVLDPAVRQVHVRLSADGAGAAPGSQPVSLTCVARCDTTDSVWGGRSYDPSTAAPFGGGPACNGRWHLQVAVDGGAFGSGTPVVASAPPSSARDVRVAIDGRDAVVTWGRAPEPDVAGYRIERRSGDAWTTVGVTGPDASRFVDADVEVGSYDWRVVSLRPDGYASGGPAAPCADREPDLATTSSTTSGRVAQPRPSPSPTDDTPEDDDTPDDASPGDDGGAGSGQGPAAGDGTHGSPDAGAPDPTGEPTGASGEAGPAPAAAPSGGDDTAAGGSDEELVGEGERYYGEDQGLGPLDYGDVDPVGGDGAGPDGATAVAGGVSVPVQRDLDRIRILQPIAGGLVLLTFAFHIRRWQREHDV